MFDTWMLLLRDYGTLRLADVLAPAISYARNGHPLVERATATIAMVEDLFRDHWPTSAAVYLPGGKVPEPGTLFTNTTLAETYARVLREAESAGCDRVAQIERARKTWSQGFVAEAIDKFCRTQSLMDISGEPHRGVLTGADMARWQPRVEAPADACDYGRYTVCKAGVWSQGPVLLQQFALLEGFDLDELDPAGRRLHPLAGRVPPSSLSPTARRSTAIRISSTCRSRRCCRTPTTMSAASWSPTAPRSSFAPATIEGFGGAVQMRRRRGRASPSARRRRRADRRQAWRSHRRHRAFRHHRCRRQHGVLDAIRRLAAILAGDPRARLLPRHPRAEFWLDETHPAALVPGKRPRTTLSPTLALRDGEPYLAWGSPGGDQQDQWMTQFFLRHVHANMNLQEAIDAPAWHSEHFPIIVLAAHGKARRAGDRGPRPEGSLKELRRRGHTSKSAPPGRKAGSPRLRAWAIAAAPPPIRAACKGMRRGDN